MSHFAGHTKLSELTCDEFKQLVDETLSAAIARATPVDAPPEFIGSKACAALLNITPEHLCAMRARGEGPPWSGDGKWVRYRRDQAISWLTQLPRKSAAPDPTPSRPDSWMPVAAQPP